MVLMVRFNSLGKDRTTRKLLLNDFSEPQCRCKHQHCSCGGPQRAFRASALCCGSSIWTFPVSSPFTWVSISVLPASTMYKWGDLLCYVWLLNQLAFSQGSQGGRKAEGLPHCGQTPFYPYYNRVQISAGEWSSNSKFFTCCAQHSGVLCTSWLGLSLAILIWLIFICVCLYFSVPCHWAFLFQCGISQIITRPQLCPVWNSVISAFTVNVICMKNS